VKIFYYIKKDNTTFFGYLSFISYFVQHRYTDAHTHTHLHTCTNLCIKYSLIHKLIIQATDNTKMPLIHV